MNSNCVAKGMHLQLRWFLCLLWLPVLTTIGCWSSNPRSGPSKQTADKTTKQDAEALNSLAYRDWYDSVNRDYRPPVVVEDQDHMVRRDGASASRDPKNPVAKKGRGRFFSGISAQSLGYLVLVLLGTALLGIGLALLAISIRGWIGPMRDDRLTRKEIQIDPTRAADLPFDAQSQMQDPLAYARQLMAAGKYDQAMLYLYGYMLLALDRAGKIVLHRGKTNRMYLHELISEPNIKAVLSPAMLAFEEVFFGRHSIERDQFFAIWNSLDEFHRVLAPAMAERSSLIALQAEISEAVAR